MDVINTQAEEVNASAGSGNEPADQDNFFNIDFGDLFDISELDHAPLIPNDTTGDMDTTSTDVKDTKYCLPDFLAA